MGGNANKLLGSSALSVWVAVLLWQLVVLGQPTNVDAGDSIERGSRIGPMWW